MDDRSDIRSDSSMSARVPHRLRVLRAVVWRLAARSAVLLFSALVAWLFVVAVLTFIYGA